MANIYTKADPKNKSVKRWMGRVKVREEWVNISLRLLAEGNKREALARINGLEAEIKTGAISPASREWMGDQSYLRIVSLMGRQTAYIVADRSHSEWSSALESYLKATDARDTRVVVKGKVKAEELTKISRKNKLQAFVRWAEENKVKFLKTPFTVAVIDYIEYRKSKGIGSTTIWSCDYPKLCCWGDWMAKRSICEAPNRDIIREHMPEKTAPVIEIPSWESDLESLRFWHKMRLTDPSTGLFSKRSRTYWPNWCLILVVRGLGCRPSEATALSWETVELDRNCVRFLRSKNDRSRRVPILFQWVRDGLTEAWERAGRPTSGPVCLNSRGTLWEHDSSACSQMKALCDHHR